jgi:hypothetical protein
MKRRRQKVVLLCLWGWLFFEPFVLANALPPSQSYQISSGNGSFFSRITTTDSIGANATKEFTGMLQVYTRDSSLLWQQPMTIGKTPVGILSDDGAYFCYVKHRYTFQAPVVVIYRKDQESIPIPGKQFNLPGFPATSTDALWLGEAPFFYVDEFNRKLIIYTIDSQRWSIDIETGQVNSFTKTPNHGILIFLLVSGIVIILSVKIGVHNLLITPKH